MLFLAIWVIIPAIVVAELVRALVEFCALFYGVVGSQHEKYKPALGAVIWRIP